MPNVYHVGLQERTKARFKILANRESKRIILFVNNSLMMNWTDFRDFPKGNCIFFYARPTSWLKVSNIRVRKWDGTLPDKNSEPSKRKADYDTLMLLNGDQHTGRLFSIEKQNVSFRSSYTEMKIPINRITHMIMRSQNRKHVRITQNNTVAIVRLRNGVKVTLESIEAITGRISGMNMILGKMTIPVKAVTRITFNADNNDDW